MTAPATKVQEPEALPAASPQQHSPRHRLRLRRMARFILVISTFLLSVNAFVCATWSDFFGVSGWPVWQVIPGILAVAFIGSTLIGFRHANALLRAIYAASATWIGTLNFLFFAAIACWVVDGIAALAGWPWPRFEIAVVMFGTAFAAAAYGLINAAWLRVTRVSVALPNLPEAWLGRTIALVTDVHLGHLSGPSFLRRIIARLRSVQPDAVMISGDMFDGTTVGLDRLVAPWRDYSAPRGIYYVTGNHDEFAEREIYLNAVQKTGVRVLNNEKVSVDGLQIVGVHDSEATDADELRKILREVQIDPRQPSILIAHQPVNLSVAEEEGISLQLSGHTHGGQIWPWTLLVNRIFGRFAHGLSRLGKLWVYTSYGAGTWGPPLRVGTRSEIILIRFDKET